SHGILTGRKREPMFLPIKPVTARKMSLITVLGILILAVMPGFMPAQAQTDGLTMLTIASEPKANVKTIQAKVVIEAPPAMVWNVITDYPDLKNILPGYEKSSLIKSGASGKILDIAMKVAAFLPTYKYQVRVQENSTDYRITL